MVGITITLDEITTQAVSFMSIPVVPVIISMVLAVGIVSIVVAGLIDLLPDD